MQAKDIETRQSAVAIYYYLLEYNNLESIVKKIYKASWSDIDNEVKNRVMFYSGGMTMESRFIEYDSYEVVRERVPYRVEQILNRLTLNQVMRLEKHDRQLGDLNFNIQSYKEKMTVYPCVDCILKLINMRNILAHNMVDLDFKEKHKIETLSNQAITSNSISWIEDFDLERLNESTRDILSNYIFMEHILEILRSK